MAPCVEPNQLIGSTPRNDSIWFRMPAFVDAIMIFHISALITGGIINGSSISARITLRPGMRACRNSATASPSPT